MKLQVICLPFPSKWWSRTVYVLDPSVWPAREGQKRKKDDGKQEPVVLALHDHAIGEAQQSGFSMYYTDGLAAWDKRVGWIAGCGCCNEMAAPK